MAMIPMEYEEKDTWHQVSGYEIYYKKSGNIVCIQINDTITSNSNVTLNDVIPTDYRPSKTIQTPALGASVANSGVAVVYTNGDMLLYIQGSSQTNSIRTTITYIV